MSTLAAITQDTYIYERIYDSFEVQMGTNHFYCGVRDNTAKANFYTVYGTFKILQIKMTLII